MDTLLFQVQSPYDLPKLKLLPLREQPAYRVAQNADACNLAETAGCHRWRPETDRDRRRPVESFWRLAWVVSGSRC
jgi:hypothetical protein